MHIFRPLTPEEHEAITRFALQQLAQNPDADWKKHLRKKWAAGTVKGVLHRLVITHGVDWLADYSLADWPMERFRKGSPPD